MRHLKLPLLACALLVLGASVAFAGGNPKEAKKKASNPASCCPASGKTGTAAAVKSAKADSTCPVTGAVHAKRRVVTDEGCDGMTQAGAGKKCGDEAGSGSSCCAGGGKTKAKAAKPADTPDKR
ncbi:MAG: hypothetical protein WB626_01275 [Bacteroidota bacterium]